MDIRIEPLACHPALTSVVAGWHFAEWGHADPGGSESGWAHRLAGRAQLAGIPSYYVAFVDETPAGSVGLCTDDMSTHPELSPWLSGLYVLPRFRRRGVGGLLVLHAMRAARKAGVQTLFLHTSAAEGLYTRHGWHRMARELYEGEDVSILFARLGD
jgi:GNAT superfamily N-acetyltransferase